MSDPAYAARRSFTLNSASLLINNMAKLHREKADKLLTDCGDLLMNVVAPKTWRKVVDTADDENDWQSDKGISETEENSTESRGNSSQGDKSSTRSEETSGQYDEQSTNCEEEFAQSEETCNENEQDTDDPKKMSTESALNESCSNEKTEGTNEKESGEGNASQREEEEMEKTDEESKESSKERSGRSQKSLSESQRSFEQYAAVNRSTQKSLSREGSSGQLRDAGNATQKEEEEEEKTGEESEESSKERSARSQKSLSESQRSFVQYKAVNRSIQKSLSREGTSGQLRDACDSSPTRKRPSQSPINDQMEKRSRPATPRVSTEMTEAANPTAQDKEPVLKTGHDVAVQTNRSYLRKQHQESFDENAPFGVTLIYENHNDRLPSKIMFSSLNDEMVKKL